MEETVIPSKEPMSEGQIGKVNEVLAAKLRKHKNELPSDLVQIVLGDRESTLIDDMFALLRKRVEAMSNMIVRTVKVNRRQSPKEMLDATGRKQYTDDNVVAKMPKGEGEETEVIFFKLGRQINDNDLEKEYELRGLKPADPYSLAKVNQDDPAFADTNPNGTHWKDAKGNWYFTAFFRWRGGERSMRVDRVGHVWDVHWWFAGVRK